MLPCRCTESPEVATFVDLEPCGLGERVEELTGGRIRKLELFSAVALVRACSSGAASVVFTSKAFERLYLQLQVSPCRFRPLTRWKQPCFLPATCLR